MTLSAPEEDMVMAVIMREVETNNERVFSVFHMGGASVT